MCLGNKQGKGHRLKEGGGGDATNPSSTLQESLILHNRIKLQCETINNLINSEIVQYIIKQSTIII